jgi:hypothetical protein
MDKADRFGCLLVACLVAFCVWLVTTTNAEKKLCEERGGVYLAREYVCVRGIERVDLH